MRVKICLLCLFLIIVRCNFLNSQNVLQNTSLEHYDEIRVYGLPKYISTRAPVTLENISNKMCLWRINREYDYLKTIDTATVAFFELIRSENDGFIRIRIDFLYENKIVMQYGIDKRSYDEAMSYIQTLLSTD